MVDQKYVAFLNKLIDETKNRKTHWKYLDKNEELCISMDWAKESSELSVFVGNTPNISMKFNTEDSFYTTINGTYIVIYVWENKPAKLYVIPSTYKKVIMLTPDEYGEHITRLLNLVQSQFPSAEAFIDSFLNNNTGK